MAETSKIQGYDIKDASARSSISTINTTIGTMDDAIGDLQEDVSGISERLDFYLQVNPILSSGTKIATLSVENVDYDLYAPQGGGTSGIQSVSGANSATCTTDASGNVTVDVSYITTGNESGYTPATRCTVEGLHNRASAPASHVEGTYNNVSANATQCGHAEGSNNTVNGINGHAEGNGNTVGGSNGHAEGNGNTVGGSNSHAEGDGNTTSSTATCAHVGGYRSFAGGNSSFAQGYQVKTTNTGECAVGSFNKSDSLTRFSVGNGNSDSNRSNLFEITSAGSAIVSGELHTGDDVYIGGQNIYINNASSVQKEISIDANNQLCIDSIPISGGGGSHAYSTAEQVVGTWIDGKPVYEKTFITTAPSALNTSESLISVADLNIDSMCMLTKWVAKDTAGYNFGDNAVEAWLRRNYNGTPGNDYIACNLLNSTYASEEFGCIIRYTKRTT